MPQVSAADKLLVDRIRSGQEEAWEELISQYEGRLLAFVESRLRNRAAAEDVVQEALIGFVKSIPNFDRERPLESYLFSIAAHKLTDHLRREGRRPALPFSAAEDSSEPWDVAGRARPASSLARSDERRNLETAALAQALLDRIDYWKQKSEWVKIECMELLFVRGWSNKRVAGQLSLSEQQVANFKFDFLARIRRAIREQGLSEDVFPELYDS